MTFNRGANIVARIFCRQKTKKKKKKLANLKKKIELDALEFIKNKIAVFQKP